MQVLIFSDLHSFDKNNLNHLKENYDICIFLGDIKSSTLKYIITNIKAVPIYAILGNHDDNTVFLSVNNYLKQLNKYHMYNGYYLINFNLQKYNFGDYTFTGIEGAEKYKNNQPGYTQEESIALQIPEADILVSHDTGYNYMKNNHHYGLLGINNYIQNKQPQFHIFGHYHVNTFLKKEKTNCYCVYGCSIFEPETNTMINIF